MSEDDTTGFGKVFAELRQTAHCIEGPVSAPVWSRFLFTYATVQYGLSLDWRAPLRTALIADPSLPREVGIDDLRGFPQPVVDDTHHVPVADDGIFFLDGIQVEKVPPGRLAGPHLVQSYAAGRWETRYLEDQPYPGNWLAPQENSVGTTTEATVEPVRPSPAPLVAGIGLVGAGAAAGVTTWALTRDRPVASQGEEAALKGVNVGGWALAGVGLGLITVHVARGVQVGVSPSGLVIRGGR